MSDRWIEFTAIGLPAPQGSKRAFVNKKTGRAHVVENNSDKVSTWRQDVKDAAVKAMGAGFETFAEPVDVVITFELPRPKSHYRTGKHANELRDDAPFMHTTKPDLDKLIRSTLDALTAAGVWRDDSLAAAISASKVYADGAPLARITIYGENA